MSLTQRFLSDAFRDMHRAMAAFDEPFFNAARRSLGPASSFLHHRGNFLRYPATDMVETPEAYELHAELPGFDKKNIKIELADNQTLVLSGQMEEQHEVKSASEIATEPSTEIQGVNASEESQQKKDVVEKGDNDNQIAKPAENGPQYWVKERMSGSFSRSFAFPQPVKGDAIKASFDNGVLKVFVPKTVETQAKQINIE